ncbi:MAG: hypothetical protein PHO00_03935 [bacterium]|nr:hypothetical protein [bacterium]
MVLFIGNIIFRVLFFGFYFLMLVPGPEYVSAATQMLKVRPGEWTLYDTQGKAYQLQKVVKVNNKEMVVEYSTIIRDMFGNPKVIGKSEAVLPRYSEHAASTAKNNTTSKDFIRVKNEMVECTVITYPSGLTNWISTDIPVSGLVKSVKKGKVLMQLIDYGKK